MTDAVESKIEKLLRVADGAANENESLVALQMAQKLADAHNLDLGTIGKTGARKDENVSKGLYQYQRTLYATMADLNHCKSWITKGTVRGSKYTIRLLGSKVNVTTTKVICDYVEEVANRLVKAEFSSNKYFSKEAHLFREGVIDRMVQRIRDRRREEEAERQREKREQEARMRHPGASTENAIVLISDVRAEEEKANYDYLNGEGAWDRREAMIEKYRREREEAAEAYRLWELANPEEVAKQKAEQERREEQERKRRERLDRQAEKRKQERINRFGYDPQDYRGRSSKYDHEAYWQGSDAGAKVNIDTQIDRESRKAIG